MPFRQAHQVVGQLVAQAEKQNVELHDLPLDQLQAAATVIENDVYDWLGAENVVARYTSEGAAGTESFKTELQGWKDRFQG